VIVVVSKPPSPKVAARVLRQVRGLTTPVVVCFVGAGARNPDLGSVHFAASLEEAAETAVELAGAPTVRSVSAPSAGYVRGLFSGGTLALEVAHRLAGWLAPLATNLGVGHDLEDPEESVGHTIVDLGADELTLGRPHPMIDPSPVYDRLRREGADRDVGVVVLDVVLGDGAHPDPAAGLAQVIEEMLAQAQATGRKFEVVCLVVGTRRDPQNLDQQIDRLESAGARVVRSLDDVVRIAADRALSSWETHPAIPVALEALQRPVVINVGLESFADSLATQEADVVRVDWRPPAGGDPELAAILRRMKGRR
jgi:FdrA protein